MNLKNKTLALVVASALVMPSALAVEGSDGMHYTSASEGFYTSIRVRFSSGTTDGDNAQIQNSSSRLGVRGSSEMSHGLEGFYNYEVGFEPENGSGLSTRMAHVGLRGGFGSVSRSARTGRTNTTSSSATPTSPTPAAATLPTATATATDAPTGAFSTSPRTSMACRSRRGWNWTAATTTTLTSVQGR